MSANNKISNLIESQVPFFVRNDHPQFVAFLTAWTEYMEQSESSLSQGKVLERIHSMQDYFDIDTTHSELEEELFEWFLEAFPPSTLADRVIILKSAKDFLRARGTEKSVEFLLRATCGIDDVAVYYPKLDILRVSDGNWYIQQSLRVGDITVDGLANTSLDALQLFVDRPISGLTSNAIATVSAVDRYFSSGVQVDELTLSAIRGNFDNAEEIQTLFIEQGMERTLRANIFGGSISSATIVEPGTGYSIGDTVAVEDSTGSGACVRVSSVSTGNVPAIQVIQSGAGFRANDYILITGGGGSGANAFVFTVDESGNTHPNTYNIYISSIAAESNTLLSNTYANLNNVSANTIMANAFTAFLYTNTGPVSIISVNDAGTNYTSVPSLDISANTRIKSLGILGRVDIIDGGTGYANGDVMEFQNTFAGYGVGANGYVTVDGSGTIIRTTLVEGDLGGIPIGGIGYTMAELPTVNVITSTGSSANLQATAVLGDGETLSTSTGTIGAITGLIINAGGNSYSNPVANLSAEGDGTATANLLSIAGAFSYPGRYLDDDSHISGFSFLEDQDYYQNFSYVIRIAASLKKYKEVVDHIVTPAGVILFGEFMSEDNGYSQNITTSGLDVNNYITLYATYEAVGQNVQFTTVNANDNIANGQIITVEFLSGDTANLTNTILAITDISSNQIFNVVHSNGATTTSGTAWVG